MSLFRLDNRVAVVTGGALGLGAATVKILADQGARVAVWDLAFPGGTPPPNSAALRHYTVDVADLEGVQQALDAVVRDFGRVDILVNNAAICPRLPFATSTEADWNRIVDINAKSQFFLMQKVAPLMKKQGGGRIVNVSSTSGRMGAVANASIYSGTKAAVIAMTKSIARELAGDGILVNCVAPGTMDTALMRSLPPERLREICHQVPLKRLGRPEEIAACICFLAGDACSYCTGATFDVNGGWAMY